MWTAAAGAAATELDRENEAISAASRSRRPELRGQVADGWLAPGNTTSTANRLTPERNTGFWGAPRSRVGLGRPGRGGGDSATRGRAARTRTTRDVAASRSVTHSRSHK
jgi:hypothetical protein